MATIAPQASNTFLPCCQFCTLLRSEASSCRSAIRAARGVVNDIGAELAEKSRGLKELSSINEHNSERDVETLQRQYQLRLPVQISELKKSPGVRYLGNFHVIALESWAQFLVDYNVWHVVVGLHQPNKPREEAILAKFWDQYRSLFPDHQLWALGEKHGINWARCCPVLMHGDEGRGRKRAPFLVTSYHSVLGFGTAAANAKRCKRPYISMKLNYSGSTHIHRLLSGCLPKMVKDDAALQDLLSFMANDCVRMIEQGVRSQHGDRYWMACINICGDWRWLQKCANLERSYSTVQKRPLTATSQPRGICHWCLAGTRGVDFEDLTASGKWKQTMFLPGDAPWKSPPVLLKIPHQPLRPAALFSYDLFHSWHLGLGKVFAATALALITDRFPEGAVDARFCHLTDLYMTWCDEQRKSPFITCITKETCGWPDRKTFPNGQWSKGHVTTSLMHFIQDYFSWNDVSDDIMLAKCKEATTCFNFCLSSLYDNDVWLSPEESRSIGQTGMKALRLFMENAKLAFDRGEALWAYMPKSHVCCHIFDLLASAPLNHPTLSPLVHSVQVDEDYIGRKSRLSRRVDPKQVVLRVIQRSLAISFSHWSESGYFKG